MGLRLWTCLEARDALGRWKRGGGGGGGVWLCKTVS